MQNCYEFLTADEAIEFVSEYGNDLTYYVVICPHMHSGLSCSTVKVSSCDLINALGRSREFDKIRFSRATHGLYNVYFEKLTDF